MENTNWNDNWEQVPPAAPKRAFPTEKKELFFGLFILLFGMAVCNFIHRGGFNLGFSIGAVCCILCSFCYFLVSGYRPTVYSSLLLIFSLVISAAFARTDDIFVKTVMVAFLAFSVNLGFTVMTGKAQRDPGHFSTLWDAPRAIFTLGIGKSGEAIRGLNKKIRSSGSLGQKSGAFLLGIGIAVPLLAIMLPLLIRADAAFDGMLALLPEIQFSDIFFTLFFGTLLACVLYTRGVALSLGTKEESSAPAKKKISAITVNTVLSIICLMYLAYLVSQLAYFSGGFSGILPEGYSMAEYARRGFFEMAWLCAINLGIIGLSLGLIRKENRAPLACRLLCLFIGLITLFMVAAASAKMFLYIDAYGLTRLRVLTQIIMLFLALSTLLVMLYLFIPKLPYMKAVILIALLLGAVTIWADVDTQVATYNVDAYLSGKLETIDIRHISLLGNGAVPQLHRLSQEAPDPAIRTAAANYLKISRPIAIDDFRDWNYVNQEAAKYCTVTGTP